MALGTLRRQMLHRAVARRRQLTAPHAPRMASALELVAVLGRQNAEIAQQFQELMREMAPQLEQLGSMPGVGAIPVRALIADNGLDMTHFGSASHRSSWAGLSPGYNERAAKRAQGRTRTGRG